MMQFSKTTIQAAAADVAKNADIELVFNENDLLVIAETSQAVNEFETRLAAHTVVWEGPACLDAGGMLRTLTDMQGERTELRTRYNGEWQARYAIQAQ